MVYYAPPYRPNMKQKVKVSDIIVSGRRRSVAPAKVSALAEFINRIGLLNPITIDRNRRYGGFRKNARSKINK